MSIRKGDVSIPLPSLPAPVSLWKWTRGSGSASQFWREGSFQSLMAKVPEIQGSFDSITITRKVGNWFRLEAAQADDNRTETYEVLGSDLSQSKLFSLVLRDQLINAGVNAGSVSEKISGVGMAVARYKAEGSGIAASYAKMVAEVTKLFPAGPQLTIALEFMDDLDRNGDNFLQSQYIFQRTISLSDRAYMESGSALFAGIYDWTDAVFLESELRSAEAIPDEFPLPPSVSNNSVPAQWLKKPTKCTQTNNRRTITLEYQFADYWTTLYYR